MNDEHNNPSNQPPDYSSPPGAALTSSGVSQNQNLFETTPPAQNSGASEGVSSETNGDAVASEDKSTDSPQHKNLWPPPGDELYTTDEARIYFYDKHDAYIKERHFQKLVTEKKKLIGKRVPKDGGGTILEVTRSSLDKYIVDNPQKRNAKEVPLDPKDKLFDHFRNIASRKGYAIIIESGAPNKTETPTPAPTHKIETPPPEQAENAENKPLADQPPQDAPDMVPKSWYEDVLAREEKEHKRYLEMQEFNAKLYETLDSTQERLADTQTLLNSSQEKLASIAETVAGKLESPSDIVKSLAEVFRSANGTDEQSLKAPQIIPTSRPENSGSSDNLQ